MLIWFWLWPEIEHCYCGFKYLIWHNRKHSLSLFFKLKRPFAKFFNSGGNLIDDLPDNGKYSTMFKRWLSTDSIRHPGPSDIHCPILFNDLLNCQIHDLLESKSICGKQRFTVKMSSFLFLFHTKIIFFDFNIWIIFIHASYCFYISDHQCMVKLQDFVRSFTIRLMKYSMNKAVLFNWANGSFLNLILTS